MDVSIDRTDGQFDRGIADDFLCMNNEPITDVHFWGSWKEDIKGNITNIHVAIYGDIPASESPDGYSIPSSPALWEMNFGPSAFTERHYANIAPSHEYWWDPYEQQELIPDGDQNVVQYNIYIDPIDAFFQQGTPENPVVYWLGIDVVTDNGGEFGWKTSVQHWNNDAVYKISDESPDWTELTYPYSTPAW